MTWYQIMEGDAEHCEQWVSWRMSYSSRACRHNKLPTVTSRHSWVHGKYENTQNCREEYRCCGESFYTSRMAEFQESYSLLLFWITLFLDTIAFGRRGSIRLQTLCSLSAPLPEFRHDSEKFAVDSEAKGSQHYSLTEKRNEKSGSKTRWSGPVSESSKSA
jgi:hypothetical protein